MPIIFLFFTIASVNVSLLLQNSLSANIVEIKKDGNDPPQKYSGQICRNWAAVDMWHITSRVYAAQSLGNYPLAQFSGFKGLPARH